MSNLHDRTDETLVQLYADGQDSAFDTLLERYKQKVFSYIYYRIHDEDCANDIFQETFVKVITSIRSGRYSESGKFGSWLMRIAHNCTIDYFRQKQSQQWISNDACDGALFEHLPASDTPHDSIAGREYLLRQLTDFVQELPTNQREIVLMRLFHDRSFKEIADQTGVSINTALGRMRYALLNLRKKADLQRISMYS